VDGLAVDSFPEGSAFVVGEGVEEGFAEGGVGVEVLGGVGGGGVGGGRRVWVRWEGFGDVDGNGGDGGGGGDGTGGL